MTKRKPMQCTPLDGEQCEVVKAILHQIIGSLQDCGDGRFDSGDRIAINLSKRDVGRLQTAIKKL